MPSLVQALPAEDIALYRLIASFWGIELTSPTPAAALMELAEAVCDAENLEGLLEALPPDALEALTALYRQKGTQPWQQFIRKNGVLREVGAGKRDREKLYENPISVTEVLWYRGLVSKAFFSGQNGLQEFAYIPDEIAQSLEFIGYERDPQPEERLAQPEPTEPAGEEPAVQYEEILPGRLASELEAAYLLQGKTDILDDSATLMAAVRVGEAPPELTVPRRELELFLQILGVFNNGQVDPDVARGFLESTRLDSLRQLRAAWQKSNEFNELALVPSLILEGGWAAPVLATRAFIFQQLRLVPKGKWWNINSFIRHIKDTTPDFQRPSGDYDSWIIKSAATQEYLRGFACWDEVEGELIRYFLTGPLYWLRYVDLSAPGKDAQPVSFRIFQGMPPQPPENSRLTITSTGRINIPFNASRVARYQVSRFCTLAKVMDGQIQYQVTTNSLAKAKAQGLKVDNLIALLAKHSGVAVPPVFTKALKRWDQAGSEAHFSQVTLLRFSRPQTLQEFKASRAARYIQMELNPTTVIVPAEAIELIRKALMEMGILSEVL